MAEPLLLIPAIDLKGGRCVRLQQGEAHRETVFGDDPVAMADRWRATGCRRLHLVDLDGAFSGAQGNAAAISAICRAHPDLPIQVGGGVRSREVIDSLLDAGASYVIIGTRAITDPDFVHDALARYPGKIILGVDAKDGMVAVDGWVKVTQVTALELVRTFPDAAAVVYTDIARDGMMGGLNVSATVQLAADGGVPVIASGGVHSLADLQALAEAAAAGSGTLIGAISGRALYEGSLDAVLAQRLLDRFGA